MRGLCVLMLLAPAAHAQLPDDARLAPVRAQLSDALDRAARDRVPPALLTDKVREGLAKGVPAVRIAQVIDGLERGLAAARVEAERHVSSPPPKLLKAINEAHGAGARTAEVDTVLKSAAQRGAPTATRAVEVLTDLAQRGYPVGVAAEAVAKVAARRPESLPQVAGRAESLASENAVPRAQALEALGRASERGLGLERAVEVLQKHGDDERGPSRESSGDRGRGRGRN